MGKAGNGLRIRFGLGNEPDKIAQGRWVSLTRELIERGNDKNTASETAARQVFPDYRSRVSVSESDSIEQLLRLAEGRRK